MGTLLHRTDRTEYALDVLGVIVHHGIVQIESFEILSTNSLGEAVEPMRSRNVSLTYDGHSSDGWFEFTAELFELQFVIA